jgi:8-oxo-dGTP pyrophosphatase MutT (NUDIX family)
MQLPISIKAVIRCERDDRLHVLLLRNERNEWELPGGRLDAGEQPEAALLREIREELALEARIEHCLDSHVFEVIPGRHVFIVTYACRLLGNTSPQLSHEHVAWAWFPADELPENLPEGYRQSILRAMG